MHGICRSTQGILQMEGQKKKHGMRVMLDMTDGLKGHNITCDNCFTSYALGQEQMKEISPWWGKEQAGASACTGVDQREREALVKISFH